MIISHSEEGEQQRMATSILPILQGTALFIPPVGITNDVHTLTQGKDIYGNEATKFDYTISALDLISFGAANATRYTNIPKSVKNATKTTNQSTTITSSASTIWYGFTKQKK